MITHTSGGDPIPAGVEIGMFETSANETSVTISHGLGIIPKFAIALAVPDSEWTDISGSTILLEELMSDPQTGTFDISLNGSRVRNVAVSYNNTSNTTLSSNTYTTFPASMTDNEVTFATGRYYGGVFTSGVKYIYILTK